METERLVQLNVRVPKLLKDLMKQYIERGSAHKDLSELTRDALREKLRKDVPDLYRRFLNDRKEVPQKP